MFSKKGDKIITVKIRVGLLNSFNPLVYENDVSTHCSFTLLEREMLKKSSHG